MEFRTKDKRMERAFGRLTMKKTHTYNECEKGYWVKGRYTNRWVCECGIGLKP